ncbi:MAG: DUF4011 domain-containing protein, partial [Sporichthyaceae bacterium]|nr:DUF4011 domain-containing protein [Sporichthyaceae bacterium]
MHARPDVEGDTDPTADVMSTAEPTAAVEARPAVEATPAVEADSADAVAEPELEVVPAIDPAVESAVQDWRDSLINLAGTNRLLNFRASRTSTIEIARPDAEAVLTALTDQRTLRFRSIAPTIDPYHGAPEPVPPVAPDTLDSRKDADELTAALRLITRRSKQEYLDRGVWVLYVAFGMLAWTDDEAEFASPLLLVPVRMVRTGLRQLPVLELAADEDPVVNPALALRMSQYGVTLPTVDLLDDLSLDALLAQIRAAIADHPGWQVRDDVVLSCFSFHKEAMYRDLIEHQQAIATHPIVSALVLGGRGETEADSDFLFEEIPDERIDDEAPPEATPLVLDGDSSQRACVAAAMSGRSFVMDGPPGTGKSQTIANMTGVLLHAGKTVLFVSEKAAALEVVRNRLSEVGLGPYILELHSHKATRREAASALGAALDVVPVPPVPMNSIALAAVTRRRQELNAYAEAMNAARPPLGYSVHDVLGMISLLDGVPAAPATGIAPVDLTVDVLEQIRADAAKLADSWRPATQGTSFVWRGSTDQAPTEALLYQAAAALDQLLAIAGRNTALMDELDLRRPSDAGTVAAILDHAPQRPSGLPVAWLTEPSLDRVRADLARLGNALAEITAAQARTSELAGVPADALPEPAAAGGADPASRAPWIDELTAETGHQLADSFAADADRIEAAIRSLAGLATTLRLEPALTYAEADETLAVAALAEAENRPERCWLSASGLTAAMTAAEALRQADRRLTAAEAAARPYFTEAALQADLTGLHNRFTKLHRGAGKLRADYRADRRAVATFAAARIRVEDAVRQLQLAVRWAEAARAYATVETEHAGIVGGYYTGRDTDHGRLGSALEVAASVLRRADNVPSAELIEHVARDGNPHPALAELARQTRRALRDWRSRLAPEPVPAARPELLQWPLEDVVRWLRDHAAQLRANAELASELSRAVGRGLTLGAAARIRERQLEVRAARAAVTDRATEYRDRLGELFNGTDTDLDRVRSALTWAEQARAIRTGTDAAYSAAQVAVLDRAVPTPKLAEAAATWTRLAAEIRAGFDPDRQQQLTGELDDFTDAADLIAALRADPDGKATWFAYVEARSALAARGLDVAIEFCRAERIDPALIPKVIVRAVLQEWADYHLSRDPGFATSARTTERDRLTAEYRELDRTLVASAVSEIITAVNGRRPRNHIGQAAVIQREANKKRKHMPVRTLIERSTHVVQAIKPCFMMSPLSVSQYLPADVTFDVVIFDEASQLMPGDAINCIYRGRSLITAGDQTQLPPTTFFTPTTEDASEDWSEDADSAKDFESILDLVKSAGAFRSLPLRWHYRSRHEGLIAFSNASFYHGNLVTFPSAEHRGADVGVELFVVDGVYRRGTTRDNPVEAAKVAERVIHHFDTRPDLSLGVVTFSEPQAAAVEWAVELARLDRPDLDQYFTDDRLGGFFVKNLESVQGDERDVMIFSVGYGPDETGRTTMNFGPVNRPGGWRRLNVAITRARHRVEIVS